MESKFQSGLVLRTLVYVNHAESCKLLKCPLRVLLQSVVRHIWLERSLLGAKRTRLLRLGTSANSKYRLRSRRLHFLNAELSQYSISAGWRYRQMILHFLIHTINFLPNTFAGLHVSFRDRIRPAIMEVIQFILYMAAFGLPGFATLPKILGVIKGGLHKPVPWLPIPSAILVEVGRLTMGFGEIGIKA
jgi:hypothetical protein